jgi:parallel beta-helix repeat protein
MMQVFATVTLREPTGSIVGSWDAKTQYIMNSNGNLYPLNETGLQDAIDDLSNLSGWVEIPVGRIVLTGSIFVGNGCWLRGGGNASVLFLQTNANVSMIVNYDQTNGNRDIRLSDFRLEGNGDNQPEHWANNRISYNYQHGVEFRYVAHSRIEKLTINNTASGGILWGEGENCSVTDCYLSNIANLYDDSGTGYTHWYAIGIHMDNCSYSTVHNCIVNRAYSIGICLENDDGGGASPDTDPTWWVHDITVSDCKVVDANFGFYAEWAKNCVFQSCTAEDCSEPDVYAGAAGFIISGKTTSILVDGCITENCSTGVGTNGSFFNNGDNNVFSDCISRNSNRNGFSTSDGTENTIYSNCEVYNASYIGFYSESTNVSFDGCNVFVCGYNGIQCSIGTNSDNMWGNINGGSIVNAGQHGIQIHYFNFSINGLTVRDATNDGIHIEGDRNSVKGCHVIMSGNSGIEVNPGVWNPTSDSGLMIGNFVDGGGNGFAAISLSDTVNWSIIGNEITKVSLLANYPQDGILESGNSDNNTILFNKIIGNYNAEITIVGTYTRVNCTGYDDWNFYDGVS